MRPLRYSLEHQDSREFAFGGESRNEFKESPSIPELYPNVSELAPTNSQADLDRIAEIDREVAQLEEDRKRDRATHEAERQQQREDAAYRDYEEKLLDAGASSFAYASALGGTRFATWLYMGAAESLSSTFFHLFTLSGAFLLGAMMRAVDDTIIYMGAVHNWPTPIQYALRLAINGGLLASTMYFSHGLFGYMLSLTALGVLSTPLIAPLLAATLFAGMVGVGYFSKDMFAYAGRKIKSWLFR